jgi:predicted DCC family thiol-disulfide oxidoreductase YuxK
MSGVELTLYYDGKCPFCTTEMARLAGWDRAGRLAFARHRYTMSALLGYKPRQCTDDVCNIGNPFLRDKIKS